MQKFWLRGIYALAFSSACFAGTHFWYRSTSSKSSDMIQKNPIAVLTESHKDVERRPPSRIIWEGLTQNDELYSGEAIRTFENSSARITLLKTGTIVNLEPDSLIVLEENPSGVALNFLQGSLFLNSTEPSETLTVKSDDQEIALERANIGLSKSQDGKTHLEVFGGEAVVRSNGQRQVVKENQSGVLGPKKVQVADGLKVQFPRPGQTVFLNLLAREQLPIKWQPLPPSYSLEIETGPAKNQLKKTVGSYVGSRGQLQIAAPPGKTYWRLTARSFDPSLPAITSPVFPVQIQPLLPPALLEPKTKSLISREENHPVLEVKWVNQAKYEKNILELSKDPQLKNIVVRQELAGGENLYAWPLTQTGVFYVRVTGYLKIPGSVRPLSSPIREFTVQDRLPAAPAPVLSGTAAEAPAPTLPSSVANPKSLTIKPKPPLPAPNFSGDSTGGLQSDVNGNVNVEWQAVAGAKSYKVELLNDQEKPMAEKIVKRTTASLVELKPGRYKINVKAIDEHDRTGDPSDSLSIEVPERSDIQAPTIKKLKVN